MSLRWSHFGHKWSAARIFVDGNYLKKLVGRDGIEPPTPGFSVLSPEIRKRVKMLDL